MISIIIKRVFAVSLAIYLKKGINLMDRLNAEMGINVFSAINKSIITTVITIGFTWAKNNSNAKDALELKTLKSSLIQQFNIQRIRLIIILI